MLGVKGLIALESGWLIYSLILPTPQRHELNEPHELYELYELNELHELNEPIEL